MDSGSGKARLAVFLSGGGSNLQAIIDATKAGILDAEVVLVVSNMRKAYGLQRAARHDIDSFVYKEKRFDSPAEAHLALLAELTAHATQPDHVYCHSWSPGDVLMWDNTSVMHRRNHFPHAEPRFHKRTGFYLPDELAVPA